MGVGGDVQEAFAQGTTVTPAAAHVSACWCKNFIYLFLSLCLKGPRRNLRNDLLIAADSITNTMSSLVKELNSGVNRWMFCFLNQNTSVDLVGWFFRGWQRDWEHRRFRIWTRWYFGGNLFRIFLLIQTKVECFTHFHSSLERSPHVRLCSVAEEPWLQVRASRTIWTGSWRTSSVWRSWWSTDGNQTKCAWWNQNGRFRWFSKRSDSCSNGFLWVQVTLQQWPFRYVATSLI